MTARESKLKMKSRFVFWLKEALTGKEKNHKLHRNQGEEDLEWLYSLNPTLNDLLDILHGVPEEIREGVLNYILTRILKRLYPLNHPRLKIFGSQIYINLEQSRQDGINHITPQIQGDKTADVTTSSHACARELSSYWS